MRLIALALTAFVATAQDNGGGPALFQKHCSYCHGAKGDGGRGPDLTTGRYRRARNPEDLFQVIRNGVRGTEMPAVRASDDEVRQIVAHVQSLVARTTDTTTAGDPGAGNSAFEQHCAGCHPGVGPDLRSAGSRGAAFVQESIVRPEAEVAAGYRAIRVALKDGRAVTGIRLNEDDVSVQVRDQSGALRSLLKSEIVDIDRTKPSLMPSFQQRLTAKQLEDVTAYVMGLR